MRPAIAFTKAVCERASKEGYKLLFMGGVSQWKTPNGSVLPACFHVGMSDHEALWEACAFLQEREFPGMRVNLD